MEIKVVNKSKHRLPEYATPGSAGFDFKADTDEEIILHPMERIAVPTGLYMELPEGYELSVRPRSGMALKYGITVLNTPGTIDSDYRGEIRIILINLSNDVFIIEPGMRIAQGVISKCEQAEWNEVHKLNETKRNGGFGSTGTK